VKNAEEEEEHDLDSITIEKKNTNTMKNEE
jgi:hypothetical protein